MPKIKVVSGRIAFAMQWTGTNLEDLRDFITNGTNQEVGGWLPGALEIGDWIVEISDVFYPVSKENFEAMWHQVSE